MKLVYWVCPVRNGRFKDSVSSTFTSAAYNIRAETKKEAERLRQEYGADDFGPAVRHEVEYTTGFDLLERCLGEGGVSEPHFVTEVDPK